MQRKNNLPDSINKGRLVKIVGAHNGLAAKLIEEADFDGVWASGFGISTSHAVPDANILTMSDFLNASTDMVNAASIPVVADCDTGFGNSNNVMHMVKKFEAAGIAAVSIEDKKFPKVNSFVAGRQELLATAEFAGKIMAAKSAQNTKEFMVFARTEALIAGWGMQEAIKRAQTYTDAGADAIFIHSKSKSPDEIIEFCKIWNKRSPLVICPTTYFISEAEMEKLGVNMAIYANHPIRASIKYMKDILAHLKQNGPYALDSKVASMNEVFRLQGMHTMKNNEKKYLRSDKGSIKVVIPAAGAKIDSSLWPILTGKPIGMIDINGKSLLARNIETFNLSGIQDINVIVGYQADKVNLEGAKIINNEEFEKKGIMYSIIKGIDSMADKNLIVYSDIMLDQHLLNKLAKKEEDFMIVVDSTYKKTHLRNKELELVVARDYQPNNKRVIEANKRISVCRIGKDLSEKEAHFEFIGVALLSRKGAQTMLDEYKKGNFCDSLSFADFIQYFMNTGKEVCAYEVNSGWMEIHNSSDYEQACAIVS